jgi:hypothetical protein
MRRPRPSDLGRGSRTHGALLDQKSPVHPVMNRFSQSIKFSVAPSHQVACSILRKKCARFLGGFPALVGRPCSFVAILCHLPYQTVSANGTVFILMMS